MYVNLHSGMPPGKAMFTLHVGPPDKPEEEAAEEYDVVAPSRAPAHRHLESVVIEKARAALVDLYGPAVVVYGVVNQSAGYIVYDSRRKGFRPIPVVPPVRLAESFYLPYDAFIDLCGDAHDDMGTDEYLDYLTQEG